MRIDVQTILRRTRCHFVAALAAMSLSLPLGATTIGITLDTSAFAGANGSLAFDFIDGGPLANTATVSSFSTNGILGAASTTGDVTGALPGSFTLADTAFFSEYLTGITLGSSLSFTLDLTENTPDAGSLPDVFAFYLLDDAGLVSLLTTSDPTGANALLLVNIDGSSSGRPESFSSIARLSGNAIPEPGSLLLLGSALALLAAASRPRRQRVSV